MVFFGDVMSRAHSSEDGGGIVATAMVDDYLARWLPLLLRPGPHACTAGWWPLRWAYFTGRNGLPDHQDRSWTEAFSPAGR